MQQIIYGETHKKTKVLDRSKIEAFRIEMDIPKNKTFIMPAGDNREQLIKMYPIVFNMCAEHGYNMTGRDHIIAFDTQRMV